MANYSLVVDSKFTPFTLEESLKPALLATEMHYDLEDKYNTLADTASGIEGLINPALDAELYERTKQYADDLNTQVELLSKEGLSPNLRRNLGTLKSRFASELAPIKTAYDNREKASKLVRELSIKDPSMIIERDPRTLSLKEFIDNPELDQGRYISGKDLSNRVAQAVQNAKKTIFANRPGAWNPIFGGQYYEKKNITGWTEQEINNAIAGKGPKELRDIVDNVLVSSGITEWATPEQLEAARRYSNEGLWSGLGTTDYERIQNRDYGTIPNNGGKNPKQGKDPYDNIQNILRNNSGDNIRSYYSLIDPYTNSFTKEGKEAMIRQLLNPTMTIPATKFVYKNPYEPGAAVSTPIAGPAYNEVLSFLADNKEAAKNINDILSKYNEEKDTSAPDSAGILDKKYSDLLNAELSKYSSTAGSNMLSTSVFNYPVNSTAGKDLLSRVMVDKDSNYSLYDYGAGDKGELVSKKVEKSILPEGSVITDIQVSENNILGKVTIPGDKEGEGKKQSYVDLSSINPSVSKALKENYKGLKETLQLYEKHKNDLSVSDMLLNAINNYRIAIDEELSKLLYVKGLNVE